MLDSPARPAVNNAENSEGKTLCAQQSYRHGEPYSTQGNKDKLITRTHRRPSAIGETPPDFYHFHTPARRSTLLKQLGRPVSVLMKTLRASQVRVASTQPTINHGEHLHWSTYIDILTSSTQQQGTQMETLSALVIGRCEYVNR